MKPFICLIISLFMVLMPPESEAQIRKKAKQKAVRYSIHIDDLQVRDPFILADPQSGNYYLHVNDTYRLICYESRDLIHWRYCGKSFVPAKDFWGREDFWAPDLFYYRNRYYLFVTFSAPDRKRGTSILVSDHPVGPFEPLTNGPVTPADQMCLDGTLFVDAEGMPWLLYCHEWLEVGDGEICVARLSEDLTHIEGTPQVLFRASAAPWVGSLRSNKTTPPVQGKVTDAPFVYRLEDGRLLMLWSSFQRHTGLYAIGQAISEGDIYGPWQHLKQPLNRDNGGHAMRFRDHSGIMKISYHAPNRAPSRPLIRNVTFNGTRLLIE